MATAWLPKKSVDFLEIYSWQGEKQVVYCRRSDFLLSVNIRIITSRILTFERLKFPKRRWDFHGFGQEKSDMGTTSLNAILLLYFCLGLFCRVFDFAWIIRNLFLSAFQCAHNELWHFYPAGRQVLTDGDTLVYRNVDADSQADRHRKRNRKYFRSGKIVHEQIEANTKR